MAPSRLQIQTYYGEPGSLMMVFLTNVNGTPIFNKLLVSTFASNYRFQFNTTVPSGLAGNSFTMQSFKFGSTGRVESSNPETISFQ